MRDILLQFSLGVVFTIGGTWGALAGESQATVTANVNPIYFWFLAAFGIVNVAVALARFRRR